MSAQSLYRKLLKAQRFTFGADKFQIENAQRYTRREFDKNSNLKDPKEIDALLKVAEQASIIIKRNIVQGIRKDSIFSLQLNSSKEMNDNSSIKSSKQGQPPQKI